MTAGHMKERMGKKEIRATGALAMLICLLTAYLITAGLLLLLAFLLFRFSLGAQAVTGGVIAIYLISSFCGGFLSGKRADSRKYLWGALTGFAYFLVLAAFSLMAHQGTPGMGTFTSLVLCTGGGMLGGMFS